MSTPTTHERTPPQNLDAERSVLGSMLLSRDAIAEASQLIGPEDFYRGAHRTFFEVIRDLYDRGEPVDSVTLTDALEARGDLEGVGGPLAVADVLNAVPTAANAVYYARIVAEHALRRRLIDVGTQITRLGYESGDDVDGALDRAEQLVYDIAQENHGADLLSMKELLNASFEMIERLQESDGSITGLPTGFHDFDDVTSGLQPSTLVILAGRPAMGKSALAVNIATNVAVEHKRTVVLFTLEMSTMDVVTRILSSESRVDLQRLRTGRLKDEHWPKLTQAMGRLYEAPLVIDETPAINLMEMRAKCRRVKQQRGLDLVVVDYLQLMVSNRRVDSRVQEVGEFSRGLKMMSKELDVPVLALSQLNRRLEERQDKRPQLSDLRESGSIEQDADIVCFVYRDEVYDKDSPATGEAELILAKHRNGPLRTVNLTFLGHQSRFGSAARSV